MKKSLLCLALPFGLFAFLSGAPAVVAQENLVITEFMALNNTTLADEDGQYSDWIEIYNAGTSAVNLSGWYLTDNRNNLTRWRFPDRTLPGLSFLIVFASNKDRTNAGAPLHANFALSGGGEYLALVRPDGTNIAFQYSPQFPAQRLDVSYGLGMLPGPLNLLMPTGATARILVPSSDIGTSWTGLGYSDATWLSGATGVGYDNGTNYDSAVVTDIQAQMLNVNSSAYLRIPFAVADPSLFQEMKLRMRYDDGFIAYLNGEEMLRTNAPASPTWNSAATRLHGSEPGSAGELAADFDTVTNAYTGSIATTGGGVGPAPSIQDANAGSTGRFLRLLNDGVNNNATSLAFDQTAPGLFPLITAQFDFRVADAENNPADGFAFMLIPTTAPYGTSGPGVFRTYVGVEEPNFANVFAIGFDVYDPAGRVNDVSAHWNGAEYVNFTIPRSTIELVSGQFHRCEVQLEYADGGAYVTVLIRPNINAGGGTPFTPINRWFIPNMQPYDCRVEFAGRNGGLNMSVDLDNINVQFGYPAGLVPREEFDLSRFLPLLQAGDNVLAIHGLNVAADSPDFLIEPELVARAITLQTTAQLFFETPTPGAANGTGAAEVAPVPVISVPSGVYTSNLTVRMTSALPGSVIRYTLNGDQPTEDSPAYSNAITVANSALLTARVYAPDYLLSPPVQRSYTLLDPSVVSFSSGLPIILIDTFGKAINQNLNPRVTCNFTVIDAEPGSGRATLLSRPNFQGRAGLEGRGQTSWGFPKKPYNVELRDAYDQDLDVSLLGMPAESDWILLNPHNDKTFLNDFLSYELFEKMGHYQVRRRYVEVFLNGTRPDLSADPSHKVGNSGDYVGIFVLLERIKIGNDRVDIQGPQTGDPGDPITGGYIWKKDKASPGDVVFTTLSQTSTDPGAESLKYHEPKPRDMTPVQRAWLTNHLMAFETVLYGPSWRDPVNGYAQWIDMHSWVDHHWIVEFTKQIDGYRLSDYMHVPRGGRLHFGPIWDWNLSIGNADYLDGGRYSGFYYPLISAMQHMYLRRLVGDGTAGSGDPDFRQRTIDRWGELRLGVFNTNNVIARINELTNYLNEAQARDFARWPRLGVELWPNPNPPTDGNWDVDFTKPTTYAGIIEQMKKWIIGRYGWIDNLYLKAPSLSRYSGSPTAPLSMLAPTGTVYFTTDGSDPRLAGGQVSPNAQAYTGSVTLPANARIFARAWHTNAWSPPTKADFAYPTPTLAVTEIMYNPVKPPGSIFDGEQFEFIELANTGASALDLTGLRFADGIEFTFPGGPLQQVGTDTTNAFEGTGTPYIAATLGSGSGASVQGGGPSGSYLRMLTSGTGVNRNRIAFDQTASGPYDIVTAEFDFRGNNLTAPPTAGTPTMQDFEAGGTPYVLRSYDADASTPVVQDPDAGSDGKFVRVTKQVGGEVGGVFFDTTAGTIYSNVTITFDFRMTSAGTPADGMGFVFLNTVNWGLTGSTANSWSEEPNMAGSLGIGLDNYLNAQSALEPNANHVSVHWNGAQVANGAATPSFSLVGGRFHRAQIIIRFVQNPTRALLTVKLSPDVYGAGGPTETLFSDFVINGATAYRGRPAFCARTGGAWADQDIDNVSVEYLLSDPAPAGGLSMVLLPTATYGPSGPGSGTNNYLDLPTATNVFALNFDMNIVDSVNDVNLYWNGTQRGNSTLPSATLNLDNGAFHRARLRLTRTEEGSLATMTLAPDVYGAGGASVTVFSNLLISGLAPGDARVEFAGRSGGQNLSLDLDNVKVHYENYLPNTLASGQRILLVKNRAAFESRYGTGRPIAGEYGGQLANGGERLLLLARYGVPILDFTYGDGWYPLTDGQGFSLVLANPSAPLDQWSDATTWRASTQTGGSPGLADPAPPTFVPVVINEVLSNPDTNTAPGLMDAIELRNLTNLSASVGGWYLTDDFNTPKKFRIPSPTVIPPNGYVVFYETNFNAPGSGSSGFGLRAEGEEVYLFSANGSGDLTGYYQGFDFGASEANVSFGRYVDSEGDDQFVAQSARTLGAENAGPKVGPVVVSEVMYHPPDLPGGVDNDLLEYVELHNITGSAVALGPDSTNTWHLRDAVDYHFPEGASIPAGGYLLIVSFDPAWDVSAASLFRAAYGLPPTVPLYGPYDGKLDNSDDRVELTKPGTPDRDTGEAPNILGDKVRYHDHAPWPQAADGAGFSLHRINVNQFGNDPINWAAEPPTPSGTRVPGTPPTIVTQPTNQTVIASQTATLNVIPGGTGPFSYQWRFNGNNLPGATSDTLVLANAQVSQSGAYQVVVLNASGAVDSAVATQTVVQAATIIAQPAPRYVNPGGTTNFSVVAIGNGPIAYQWRFNGGNLNHATNASLVLTNVQLPNDGEYDVLVTDAVATISTVPARLVVLIRPVLTQNPTPTNSVVAVGEDLTLTADATGTQPLLTRWRRAGNTNLVVNGGLTLTLTNIALTEAGYYDVVVTNLAGGTTPAVSSRAYVTTLAPPADRGVLVGGNASFQAIVRSAGPSTNRFWWLHNGTTVVGEGTNIAPTTATVSFTNNLALPNVASGQAGQYTFMVSNVVVVGSRLVSATKEASATLVVGDTTPPNITCPGSFTVNADPGQCTANPSYPPPVATDNVGVVGTACAPAGPYPVGATVVTCWAWDLTGNSNSCTFTITVADTQNPTVSGCPAPVTLTAGPSGQVAVPDLLGGVTANDNCGTPTLTQAPPAGTLVGGGTNVVTITARDGAGNIATCETAVIVEVTVTEIHLAIELEGTNVVIRWPAGSGTWTLEETDALTTPPDWDPSSAVPTQENGQWRVVVPVAEGTNKFFRLKSP